MDDVEQGNNPSCTYTHLSITIGFYQPGEVGRFDMRWRASHGEGEN